MARGSVFTCFKISIINGGSLDSLHRYDIINTKNEEKRKRFSEMCLLNRCEASRTAACTYDTITSKGFDERRRALYAKRQWCSLIRILNLSFGKCQATCSLHYY